MELVLLNQIIHCHTLRNYFKTIYLEKLYERSGSSVILSPTSIFNAIHYKCVC